MVNDPAAQADVIIVLGDDNYAGDRASHAADLYRMGLAPVVVASGRALRPYAGIAEMMEHDLESHGVPAASIVKFSHRAENTREEAEALADSDCQPRLEAGPDRDLQLSRAARAVHF